MVFWVVKSCVEVGGFYVRGLFVWRWERWKRKRVDERIDRIGKKRSYRVEWGVVGLTLMGWLCGSCRWDGCSVQMKKMERSMRGRLMGSDGDSADVVFMGHCSLL